MGLSFAYAGSARADLLEIISPLILDSSNSMEVSSMAALALGIIFVGTCDDDVANSILQTLMSDRSNEDLDSTFVKFFGLALGLLFLCKQERADAIIEAIGVIEHSCKDFLKLCVEGCAYACSGNVLKIQSMLHECAEHKEEKESKH